MSADTADLREYRDLRRTLETAILPIATSVDGLRFEYQASLHGLELAAGGYVVIETETGSRIGQLQSLRSEQQETGALDRPGTILIRCVRGEGAILGGEAGPFHEAPIRPATSDEVSEWLTSRRLKGSRLAIGELALAAGVPFALDADGFGRHTFLCGQSGSGKTYSLGVLLEQLLMQTRLRLVVLDPNSDYVRLGETSPTAEPGATGEYAKAAEGVRVLSGTDGTNAVKLRFRDLSPQHQAALMQLDPVADRSEYAELLDLVEDESITSVADLAASPAEALKLRARNLGLDKLGIWPGTGDRSLTDEIEGPEAGRCTIVDLGSLPTHEEQAVVAGAVLERLWRHRTNREPVAIVIDEAHNICPAEPKDGLTALTAADVVRIAGEGRKYGLYLIVVTQRPDKLDENVISQCDNLILMRMNSTSDVANLARVFSFAPQGLLDRAPTFGQGEALAAGKIASHPALIRFGARISQEGGADVAGWATPE